MKLKDLKGKFVILCEQNKETGIQKIAYVKNIENDKVQIVFANRDNLHTAWEKLENKYASDNWMTLEDFFEKSETVGKKIIFEQPDLMQGQVMSLLKYKDIQLIVQFMGTDMQVNIISDNICKNKIINKSIKDCLMETFERSEPLSQILDKANYLQDKKLMLQTSIIIYKQLLHVNDYVNERSF